MSGEHQENTKILSDKIETKKHFALNTEAFFYFKEIASTR